MPDGFDRRRDNCPPCRCNCDHRDDRHDRRRDDWRDRGDWRDRNDWRDRGDWRDRDDWRGRNDRRY